MAQIDFYQVSLKTFLRNPDGKVLVLEAPPGWMISGYVDFPGGRIDEGEHDLPAIDIIKRELKEEIGVTDAEIHPHPVGISRARFLKNPTAAGKDTSIMYIFFEAHISHSKIQLLEEYKNMAWVEIETIPMDKVFPGHREAIVMYRKWLQEQRGTARR